jgi:UDP-3-O-[3-hydroxymyristoyl] glucosamine N-acyltransferase
MNAFVRPLASPIGARAIAEQIASAIVVGNPDRPIRAIGALSATGDGVLAFCDDPGGAPLSETQASVVIVAAGTSAAPRADQTLIAVEDVRAAFIDIVAFLFRVPSDRTILPRESRRARSSTRAPVSRRSPPWRPA